MLCSSTEMMRPPTRVAVRNIFIICTMKTQMRTSKEQNQLALTISVLKIIWFRMTVGDTTRLLAKVKPKMKPTTGDTSCMPANKATEF